METLKIESKDFIAELLKAKIEISNIQKSVINLINGYIVGVGKDFKKLWKLSDDCSEIIFWEKGEKENAKSSNT